MGGFRSIRFRLTVTFLALFLVVMIIISFSLYILLQRYHLCHFKENLTVPASWRRNLLPVTCACRIRPLGGLAENFSRRPGPGFYSSMLTRGCWRFGAGGLLGKSWIARLSPPRGQEQ